MVEEKQRQYSVAEWSLAQDRFEAGLSLSQIAALCEMSHSSIEKRARERQWSITDDPIRRIELRLLAVCGDLLAELEGGERPMEQRLKLLAAIGALIANLRRSRAATDASPSPEDALASLKASLRRRLDL